jgi:hypothetical protein
MVSGVGLRTVFSEKARYFMITLTAVDLRGAWNGGLPPRRGRLPGVAVVSRGGRGGFAWLGQQLGRGAPRHAPRWRARLRGHTMAAVEAVPRPPRRRRVQWLHGVDGRLLNSFRRHGCSGDGMAAYSTVFSTRRQCEAASIVTG